MPEWVDLLSADDEVYDPAGTTLVADRTGAAIDELDGKVEGKEDDLGNPTTDGFVLSSTIAGARSWVDPAGAAGTDLGNTPTPTQVTITSSTGADTILAAAGANAGVMTAAQVTSLNGKLDATAQAADSVLLDGQNGAYYLARGNHTGQDEISDVNGLQAALDAKLEDLTDATFPTYALFDEEVVVASSTTPTVNFANGNKQILTLGHNATITLQAPAGKPGHCQLKIIQDPTGNHSITIAPPYKKLQRVTFDWDLGANAMNLLNIYWDGVAFWLQQSKWEDVT